MLAHAEVQRRRARVYQITKKSLCVLCVLCGSSKNLLPKFELNYAISQQKKSNQ